MIVIQAPHPPQPVIGPTTCKQKNTSGYKPPNISPPPSSFPSSLFLFCLLVFSRCCFLCISPSKSLFPRSNLTSGKLQCVTFCCVTQTKQACELSARNYRFEILQRIQKRRLIGENCFGVQIRQNHFISEGFLF